MVRPTLLFLAFLVLLLNKQHNRQRSFDVTWQFVHLTGKFLFFVAKLKCFLRVFFFFLLKPRNVARMLNMFIQMCVNLPSLLQRVNALSHMSSDLLPVRRQSVSVCV